ncbi:MAG TPA: hypothetical protein VEG84_02895, partial [Thermoanaerobaculia bacterium]|nr:hypothetical protein [Thermoanaerobaculia bacterium]
MRFLLSRPAGEPAPEDAPLPAVGGVAVDVLLLGALGALVAGVVGLAQRWNAPMHAAVAIDLDPRALPGYTLLSLSRGFAAYLLSLL